MPQETCLILCTKNQPVEEMKPNGAWKPGFSKPAVKDFPHPEVLQKVSEQHNSSGVGRGIYWRENLGWVLVGMVLGMLIFFLAASIVYGVG
jgi:hypothetical protein